MAYGKCTDTTIEIEAMLSKASVKTECCIYKVPHEIRKLNQDAYTPKVVSIGPFHYWDPILQKMKSQKQIYLKSFLKRTKINLDSLVCHVEKLEERVRCYYSEDIDFSKEEFVKMIILDAGFILEFFFCYKEGWKGDDALLWITWLSDSIIKDLCLLENQLPFFVLDELYNLAFINSPRDNLPTFLHLTCDVFSNYNKQKLYLESATICHFTDLLRAFHLQSFDSPLEAWGKTSTHLNNVNELREAGFKFRANKINPCLLDLQLLDHTLEIPQLTLDDETEMLFCNMIALEQYHYPVQPSITDYVRVLSCLIKTDEDADFLVKNGIIVNYLNHSNNIARLFYRLGRNAPVLSINSDYYPLFIKLKIFCKSPKTRMIAALRRDYWIDLKRNYCKTPLQTLATLGGIFLLIFTTIQTICSILQVV